MNHNEATDSMPARQATPAPVVVSSAIAGNLGHATAANLGLPVKSWKPPTRTNPSQTFAEFKDKVESEWGGYMLDAKTGDIIIMISKPKSPGLLLTTLLNELSDTDGKAKEMRVFDNAGNFTIVVYQAKMKELLDDKEEEKRQSFWLPSSVYKSL